MELWIKVQKNKKLIQGLVKVDNLFVDTDIDNKWCIQQSGDTLGIYKTKERALEVLDEIQNILSLKDMYKYDRELILKSWENVDEKQVKIVREQMSVYEMPKE